LQVLAQLKKFARTVKSVREAVKPIPKGRGRDQLSLGDGSGGFQRPNANMDLSEMLRTDITGMDATVTGAPPQVLQIGIAIECCMQVCQPMPRQLRHWKTL